MEIVCDTNVWYKLGNGELDINVFGNNDLIVTALTVDELVSSKNLLSFNTAIQVRDACRAIFSYASCIEMDRPANFILSKSENQLCRSDEKIRKVIIEGLKNFGRKTDEDIKGMVKDSKDKTEPLIKEWKQPYQEITRIFNKALNRIRLNIKNNKISKANHRNIDNSSDIKGAYESIVANTLNLNTLEQTINWSKFEFLLNATNLFFKELELSKMKFKQNDVIDLLNLVYVTNERKYCTCDKKGVYKVIKQSQITAPFFYEINCKS